MTHLIWTDDLAIGIDSIDEQHKVLFNLIDQLQDAMSRGESRSVLQDIFQGLITYTEKHFQFEEDIFNEIKYPDMEAHLAKHRQFVADMDDLRSQFTENTNFMIGVDVMKFLTDWLVSHIQGTDRQYAPLFKSLGIN